MHENCKYRLPCGWCDRHNRLCDIVQYEINKKPKECNHNWTIEVSKTDYMDEYGNEYCVVHKHCSECGATDVRMQQLKT